MITPFFHREARPAWLVDACLVALLFAGAAGVGAVQTRAFDASGRRTAIDFGQFELGAAVAQACGHGFVDPGRDLTPGLSAFLAVKADRFSCTELPAHLPATPPNFTQRLYRYLFSTIAMVWMIRGVSWSALWPLFAVAYGATVAVVYGLARMAAGRVAATLVALAVMVSAIHLSYLPFLRDYAKAPFILGLILLIACVVNRVTRPRSMLAYSAVFGAVLGVGFGFRNDILIVIPPFVIAVFCWTLPRDLAAAGWRLVCVVAAGLAFAVTAWPILSAYSGGSNTGHVAMLGLMSTFDRPLGVTRSVYEWGYGYSDLFINTLIDSHSLRVGGHPITYLSAEYDQAAIGYILQIARHWPADIITRAFGAAAKVIQFPFSIGVYTAGVPAGFAGDPMRAFYGWQQWLLQVLQGTGPALVVVALLLVSAGGVLRGTLLLLALVYFAGYPAVQFQVRHFFHLEFIVWLALAYVAQRIVTLARDALRGNGPSWKVARVPLTRMLRFAIVALLIVLLPLNVARAYQQPHVSAMLDRYAHAQLDPVPFERRPAGDRTLLAAALWDTGAVTLPVNTKYVVASFSPECPAVRLPITFRYVAPDPQRDYSLDVVVSGAAGEGAGQIFFPAYDTADGSKFVGVEVPRGFESCVESLAEVRDLRPFPMLLVLTLPPGWQQQRMYQTLTDWDRQPAPSDPERRVDALPTNLPVTASDLRAPADPPPVTFRVRIARDDPGGRWIVRGTPDGPRTSLIQLAAEHRSPADRFVIEGDVRGGGVMMGLLKGQTWAGDTNVTVARPGAFSVVLAPTEAGDYGVLLANAVDHSWLVQNANERVLRVAGWLWTFTDVTIRKAGWVRHPL